MEEFARIPQIMDAPLKVDYPTDDDSDDNAGFSIKVRSLSFNFASRYLNWLTY